MPVIIKNIVVSDLRAVLEESEFPFMLEQQEAADTTMVYSHRTSSPWSSEAASTPPPSRACGAC